MKSLLVVLVALVSSKVFAGPIKCVGPGVRVQLNTSETLLSYYFNGGGQGSNRVIKKVSRTGDIDMTYITDDPHIRLVIDDQYGDMLIYRSQKVALNCSSR